MLQTGAATSAALALIGPGTGFMLSRGGGTSLATVILPASEEECQGEGATPALALAAAYVLALSRAAKTQPQVPHRLN